MISSDSLRTRRNGKLQSCEPCRKSKLRCDHSRPVCGRCTTRNMIQQCFYHPSPMTKTSGEPRLRSVNGFRIHKRPNINGSSPGPNLSPAQGGPLEPPTVELSSASPGYLGSTSYSAVLAEHHKEIPVGVEGGTDSSSIMQTIDPDRAQAGLRVLALLHNVPLIDTLIQLYYSSKWFTTLPIKMIENMLVATRRILRGFGPVETEARLCEFSIQIFRNSSKPLRRWKSMALDDYSSTFIGENTRWEAMALLFASAGLSLMLYHESDPVLEELGGTAKARERLLTQVSEATSTCIAFCDQAASSNEILAFAQFTDVMLRTQRYGDSSYQAWRRLGDLSVTVYAAGLHKTDGPADDNCPFFLKQVRRCCFAAAFCIDKCVATFVGRPALINYRYCSLTPPLDLDDNLIFSGGDKLDAALSELDENGWHKYGKRQRSSLNRIRYLLAIHREQILELALGEGSQLEIPRKVSKILEEARATWDSCPDYLKYDRLTSDDSPMLDHDEVLPIFLLYVDYLHSDFLLHRTLIKYTNLGHEPLFQTARLLLSAVMKMCSDRQNSFHNSHFSWVILFYGLPSACVLAFEVLRQTQQAGPHPVVLPRSEIIRNLSVFVSCLSWVTHPGEGNYASCKEVEKKLSHILDQILDPPHAVTEDVSFVQNVDFVQNVASGLEGYLDWNTFNNWDFNSDAFAF